MGLKLGKKFRVAITLQEEMLGMSSANPELHSEFIASKSGDAEKHEEEMAALPAFELEKKTMTIFPRNPDGLPILWDYQMKGFFKDAVGMLARVPGSECNKVKAAFKKIIDGLIFVYPRQILIQIPAGLAIGSCQRPLRAETAQGPRVALANSETVPAGSTFSFDVEDMTGKMGAALVECFEYGTKRGFGQWRNSGKGRFAYEILPAE